MSPYPLFPAQQRHAPLFCLLCLVLVWWADTARAERTLHFFGVFCDAYEGELADVNDGVALDKIILDNLFGSNFSESSWQVKFQRVDVEGADATESVIRERFQEMARTVGPEDTIYVHFSGHGAILDANQGEQFLQGVNGSFFSRETWSREIEALPCRLKVFITDCCSSFPEDFSVAEGDEEVIPWKNLYALLMEHEGFVNITAASPGQPAYGTKDGGFLTINLESDMQRYSTWERVFEETKKRVQIETADLLREAGLPLSMAQVPFAYSLGRATNSPLPPQMEFVLPDSHQRPLQQEELSALSLQQLYLARNEIFARHGYEFSSDMLVQYFSSMSWYQVRPGFKSPNLSTTERNNVDLIMRVEKAQGGPFVTHVRVPANSAPPAGHATPDIFPYSSQQALPRTVLQSLSPLELSIARNEIYARHGFSFSSTALRTYFSQKPYYHDSGLRSEPNFNTVEKHNLWLIRKIERINGGAYQW